MENSRTEMEGGGSPIPRWVRWWIVAVAIGASCDGAGPTAMLPEVHSVEISPDSATIQLGQRMQLQVTARDDAGNVLTGPQVAWSSANVSIAVVSSTGLVQGDGHGRAAIVATSGAKSDTCYVTVLDTTRTPVGDPVLGKSLWQAECAACHTGREGWDVAHFSYADADIARRARPHVGDAGASHVKAYIRSLTLPTVDPQTPVFQPGGPGGALVSDREFAIQLFGVDAWPETLTPEALRAQDPRQVRISLRMPAWSKEGSLYDWLPGDTARGKLPPGVRATSTKLDTYYASPSIPRAVDAAWQVIGQAHQASDGPCRYATAPQAYDPVGCFEAAKWAATLIYVEGIRSNQIDEAGRLGAGVLWEVGHLSHKSQQFQVSIPEEDLHTAAWTYLGWMWDRSVNKNTLYTTEPLARLRLERQSTWFALRTQVERNPRGPTAVERQSICTDAREPAQWGYAPWIDSAMRFGYRYLLGVLKTGWRPPNVAGCSEQVRLAQLDAAKRAGQATATRLQPLADSIRTILAGP